MHFIKHSSSVTEGKIVVTTTAVLADVHRFYGESPVLAQILYSWLLWHQAILGWDSSWLLEGRQRQNKTHDNSLRSSKTTNLHSHVQTAVSSPLDEPRLLKQGSSQHSRPPGLRNGSNSKFRDPCVVCGSDDHDAFDAMLLAIRH